MKKIVVLVSIFVVWGCVTAKSTDSVDPLAVFKKHTCSELPFTRIQSTIFPNLIVAFPDSELKAEADSILKAAEVATTELNDYFATTYKSTYTIFLLKGRENLDNFINEKTPDWVVGVAHTNFDNLILSQKSWTEKSRSRVKLHSLVKHEMVHSYVYQIVDPTASSNCIYGVSDEGSPHWFDEGFATYVAGQLNDWSAQIKTGKDTPSTIFESLSKGNYSTAATVIEFMIEEKGKEFVLNLFKNQTVPDKSDVKISTNDKIVKALGGHDQFLIFNEGWREYLRTKYPEVKN